MCCPVCLVIMTALRFVFCSCAQVLHNAPQPLSCLVDREVAHGGDGEGDG